MGDMRWTVVWIAGMLLLAGNFAGCRGDSDLIDTVATPIAAAVNRVRIADPYYDKKVHLKTDVFYRANEYRRTWLGKRRPDKLFDAFVEEVKQSEAYGLVPRDYCITEIEAAVNALYDKRKRKRAASEISALDISITASFFLFTTHLIEGRIRVAGAPEFFWEKGMPLENDIAMRLRMVSPADLRREIGNLQPDDPQYAKLQKALKEYRALQEGDTTAAVPANISLKPGDSSKVVPTIRRKLELTDGVKGRWSPSGVYDDDLAEAVRRFQRRHGLAEDAILDRETLRLLNVRIRDKAELIALNLERLRWHPRPAFRRDQIVINVPEFVLRVYRNKTEKLNMRVVLGAEFTPTPVFHDTLKYIVFSPTWMVPRSIFEKEFLPKLQDDPFHFDTERFRFYKDGAEIDPLFESWMDEELEVERYAVIENPGDRNSLGRVKFIMPNDFSVYLHDTPADRLFNRENRALSHGCVRLEKPVDLALYLLEDQLAWNEKSVTQAMRSGRPLKVDLEKPVAVHIVYRTVWIDEGNEVHFRRDIYGHDQRQMKQLQELLTGL